MASPNSSELGHLLTPVGGHTQSWMVYTLPCLSSRNDHRRRWQVRFPTRADSRGERRPCSGSRVGGVAMISTAHGQRPARLLRHECRVSLFLLGEVCRVDRGEDCGVVL